MEPTVITFELPDGTLRPVIVAEIDSIRVARGGSDLPELRRLGVIVTYTDGTFDAVVGTFAEVCAKIANATPKPARTAEDVLNNPEPGDQVEWSDGDLWTVSEIAFDVFGLSRVILDVSTGGDLTVGAATWRSLDDAPPMPFTFVPHPPADAQPPTT